MLCVDGKCRRCLLVGITIEEMICIDLYLLPCRHQSIWIMNKLLTILFTGICPSPFELIPNSTLGAPGSGTIQAATVNTTELCKVNSS